MTNVLVINSSILGEQSSSRKLTNTYLNKYQTKKALKVKHRDLANDNLPHLSGEEMQQWSDESAESRASLSDELIGELFWADEIVLALPMYNFDSPSTFSAWVDRITRAGKTFRYTDNGPQGLLENKSLTVIFARGGKYLGTPLDTQTPYVTNLFNFIGVSDIKTVHAEGLAMGEESAKEAFLNANKKFDELIANAVD